MVQVKDVEKSSPELQALIESEVKQLLKVSEDPGKQSLVINSRIDLRLVAKKTDKLTKEGQRSKEISILPGDCNSVQQDLHYGLCKMQFADYTLQTSTIYRAAISIIHNVAGSKQANLGVILA